MRTKLATGLHLDGVAVGEGPRQVLFLHGWMTSSASFEPLWARLPTTGRTLHRIDLRGSGASDKPTTGHSLEHYASDVLAWLDTADMSDLTLVGHSMGGQIAQLVAARAADKVRRLVLLNPVPAAGLELPTEARALFVASAGNRALQGTILDMATHGLNGRERERMLDLAATVSDGCIVESLLAWTAGGFVARLADIRAQTHVLATSDPFLPADFLQQTVVDLIPEATAHHIEGPGHYPHVEDPDRTAAWLHGVI